MLKHQNFTFATEGADGSKNLFKIERPTSGKGIDY